MAKKTATKKQEAPAGYISFYLDEDGDPQDLMHHKSLEDFEASVLFEDQPDEPERVCLFQLGKQIDFTIMHRVAFGKGKELLKKDPREPDDDDDE